MPPPRRVIVVLVPAVATVLTGVYPVRHGLRGDLGGRLKQGVPTLAEGLAKAGFFTEPKNVCIAK